MKKLLLLLPACLLAALPTTATADTFSLYAPPGDEQIVTPGPDGDADFLLTAAYPSGYAGMELKVTSSLTVSQIVDLSARYEMTQGNFTGGAPRFTLFDGSLNAAYIYWGTPAGGGTFTDPNAGSTVLNSTGNFASLSSTDIRIESEGFGGLTTGPNPNSFLTWNQFESQVGGTALSYVTLDLDASFAGTQQMYVDDFTVNSEVFDAHSVPEPSSLMILGGMLAAFGLKRKLVVK